MHLFSVLCCNLCCNNDVFVWCCNWTLSDKQLLFCCNQRPVCSVIGWASVCLQIELSFVANLIALVLVIFVVLMIRLLGRRFFATAPIPLAKHTSLSKRKPSTSTRKKLSVVLADLEASKQSLDSSALPTGQAYFFCFVNCACRNIFDSAALIIARGVLSRRSSARSARETRQSDQPRKSQGASIRLDASSDACRVFDRAVGKVRYSAFPD